MPTIVSLLLAYTLAFNLESSYHNYRSQKRMELKGPGLRRNTNRKKKS